MTFTADFPGAIVVEAANYGYIGRKNNPKGWGYHTPEELADDYPATPYYFHNTDRNASTTYFVSYWGFVYQCVPEDEGAYAQAREGKWDFFPWEDPNVNLNLQSLSIEIEGFAHNIHITMPRGSPQWVSLVRLVAHRCKARGIPPENAFGHYQVSIFRSDPGQLNIPAIIADVKLLLTSPEEENDMAMFRRPDGEIAIVGASGKRILSSILEAEAYARCGIKLTDVDEGTYNSIPNAVVSASGIPQSLLDTLQEIQNNLDNPPIGPIADAVWNKLKGKL